MSKDNHEVYRQCGPGWNDLIEPIVRLANELEVTITDIKEKYAGLRIDFYPGQADTSALEDLIEKAEDESKKTCEMCGSAGRVMVSGGWLKTLCKEHGIELGYK